MFLKSILDPANNEYKLYFSFHVIVFSLFDQSFAQLFFLKSIPHLSNPHLVCRLTSILLINLNETDETVLFPNLGKRYTWCGIVTFAYD